MSEIYTTNTASLKATIADIRKLNTKVIDVNKLNVNGQDIKELIEDNKIVILDERGTLANDELDIWNSSVITDEDGNVIVGARVKPKEHTFNDITSAQYNTLGAAFKVINNEVFTWDESHTMFWQTDGLTDATNSVFSKRMGISVFESDLSSLTNGNAMFNNCNDLTSFKSDLSSLTKGSRMFGNCTNLTNFNIVLSSLTDGSSMFINCRALTKFNSDLSSLTNGSNMFYHCISLTEFSGDLSSLKNGSGMFDQTQLSSFTSKLSSLEDGSNMFGYNCNLDAISVCNIFTSLPVLDIEREIDIAVGCNPSDQDMLAFANECACDTWDELLEEFTTKNWIVEIYCTGRPTSTYSLRRGEPLPLYTKLVEVTDDAHYEYTSQDGSKHYNIKRFHLTNGSTDGYDTFNNLEEAVVAYNVTPKTIER